MSSNKSRFSSGEYALPIAESTHIDESTRSPTVSKTTLKTWDGKGIPHEANSNLASTTTMSPITSSPRIVTRPRTLDAQIYRDTQSSGLASRVVKYFENSEKKLRPIANRAYSRPGDLPIVNLDKNEITLSPRQSNGPKVAKINIGPPLRMNNQVSARSAIFRTGKNYGDNLPFTREGHSNTQSTTTLSRNVTHDNEPIASTSQEYDTNPTRSVLDALKEISRKRIHCDELDGDFMKKHRTEQAPNVTVPEHNQHLQQRSNESSSQVAKRAREQTSPSCNLSHFESQKKRYCGDDILSSLSSSINIAAPKRSSTSVSQDFENQSAPKRHQNIASMNDLCKPRPSIHGKYDFNRNQQKQPTNERVEIPPSAQRGDSSIPQASVPSSQAVAKPSTGPKLTLFNKAYDSTVTESHENEIEPEEEDDRQKISFIKPKTRTTTVFKLDRDQTSSKSKLAMMLSFLSGDADKDEVDSKSSASLSSGQTTVTFSTATTTSILPSKQIVALNTIAKSDTNVESKSEELPISTNSPAISSTFSNNTTTVLSSSAAIPANPISVTSSVVSTTTTVSSPPRVGGFSFAPTLATQSISSKPESSTNRPSTTTTASLPAFSFGTKPPSPAKSVAAASPIAVTLPTGTFSFGSSTSKPAQSNAPDSRAPETTSIVTTSVVTPTFSFDASKSTNSNISFGLQSNTSATTAGNSIATTTLAAFTFGTNAASAINTTAVSTPSIAPSTTTKSNNFSLNSAKSISTQPMTFGAATTSTATFDKLGTNPTHSFGSFGADTAAATRNMNTNIAFGSTSTVKPALQLGSGNTSSFPSFAAPTTVSTQPPITSTNNPALALFAPSTTTASTPAFPFGTKTPVTATTTSTTANIFGTPITTTVSSTFGSNSTFGSFNNNNGANVSFGSNQNQAAVFGATAIATPSFGSTGNQAPATNLFGTTPSAAPAFGSGTTAFGSTSGSSNTFGAPSSSVQTASTGIFGSSAQNPLVFGATPTTTQSASAGIFAFGQSVSSPAPNASSAKSTFAPAPTSTTSAGTAFAFGVPNNTAPNPTAPFAFGASSSINNTGTGNNTPMTAPPAFENSSSAFNFAAKSPPAFGSTANTNDSKPFAFGGAQPVAAFESAPANPSPFGAAGGTTNNNATFSFGSTATEPTKAFSFGGATSNSTNQTFGSPATAPAAAAPFAFNTAAQAGGTNAFQFNAQPQPTNIFSIGPGNPPGVTTNNKGRLIRQATRRLNK